MNALPGVSAMPVTLEPGAADRMGALFDAHHARLYRLARRLAPSADDALDLVQEAFLRAARSPMSVPVGAHNEEAWLVRVLINLRRDQWRREAVRRHHDRHRGPATDVSPHPEDAVIARATVWGALDRLSPRRRAIVVLHELEGLPVTTIAPLVGISATTVRWHLWKGRRDLARILTAAGRPS